MIPYEFKLTEDIEIKIFQLDIILRMDEVYDFMVGFYDFDTGEDMAVIKVMDKGIDETICIAVPKSKGIIQRK